MYAERLKGLPDMRPYGDLFLEPKFENIPPELRELPWAVWKAEPRKGSPGKYDKAPRCTQSGKNIGANKPDLFGTFSQAQDAYLRGGYTGVGLLLTGNGIVGIDIDDFHKSLSENAHLEAWLREAVKCEVYMEASPSRNGLRLFVKGTLPSGAPRKGDKLEIYDNKRFLTVTGRVITFAGSR